MSYLIERLIGHAGQINATAAEIIELHGTIFSGCAALRQLVKFHYFLHTTAETGSMTMHIGAISIPIAGNKDLKCRFCGFGSLALTMSSNYQDKHLRYTRGKLLFLIYKKSPLVS